MNNNQQTPSLQQAVLYARVSSKEQEKEGFSIPAQLKLLNKYASDNRFQVVQEYVDVETAKKSGRTGFTEMIKFLRKETNFRSPSRTRTTCCNALRKADRAGKAPNHQFCVFERNLEGWPTPGELPTSI